jgi:hypothetical protein
LHVARNGKTSSQFRVCAPVVRFAAAVRVFLLRLILRLWCAAFCAACRPFKVVFGRLGIVLQAYLRVVPHPQRYDVNRERFEQFRFPARPQVVEEARPRFQARALHQLVKRRPQVAISPAVRSLGFRQVVPADDVALAGFRHLEGFFEEGPQLSEQGDYQPYPNTRDGEWYQDKEDDLNVVSTMDRPLRGGSYYIPASYVRSGLRTRYKPDHGDSNVGLRLARTFMP